METGHYYPSYEAWKWVKFDHRWHTSKYAPAIKENAHKLILEIEEGNRPTLVTDTLMGKDTVSFLTILGLDLRSLFITPTPEMAQLREQFFSQITDNAVPARQVIDSTPESQLTWNNPDIHIVFSNADTILAEYEKERIDLSGFRLVVWDEYDIGGQNPAYNRLADLLIEKRSLSLSACPADKQQ